MSDAIISFLLTFSCVFLCSCEIKEDYRHPISEHCAGGYVFVLYRDGVHDPVLMQLKDKDGNGIRCQMEAVCQKQNSEKK